MNNNVTPVNVDVNAFLVVMGFIVVMVLLAIAMYIVAKYQPREGHGDWEIAPDAPPPAPRFPGETPEGFPAHRGYSPEYNAMSAAEQSKVRKLAGDAGFDNDAFEAMLREGFLDD